jgi:hypothetical protein
MKSVSECIRDLIGELESKSFVFSELKNSYGFGEDEEVLFQFNVKDVAPCFEDVAFLKNYSEDRLDHLSLTLAEDFSTTLATLEKDFGKFRMAPPEPSRTWTASAKYKTENKSVNYVIIAEAREPIAAETVIRKITIRLDHQD